MHSRLRIVLARAARKPAALSSYPVLPNPRVIFSGSYISNNARVVENSAYLRQQDITCYSIVIRRGLCSYAVEQFSDDEYECDYENHPVIF